MLTYLGIADRLRPRWLVWENVPGVLSSNGGRDFGTFLGSLVELGYGFAFRILDAQWFGVAQRRRRVFVVGYLGDAECAAKVLFESESLQRHPAPSREKGKGITGNVADCLRSGGAGGVPSSRGEHLVVGSLDTECGGGKLTHQSIANGHIIGTITARMFNSLGARDVEEGALLPVSIAFEPGIAGREGGESRFTNEVTGTLRKDMGDNQTAVATSTAVRRLTPTECERLQGFPDGYTNIPWRKKTESPDGPRYKALGNSMAVPVMRWIGERINKVNKEQS